MEYIQYTNGNLQSPNEEMVHTQIGVTIFNNQNEKSAFQNGILKLTSHRLLWQDQYDKLCIIEISLSQVDKIELKQAQQISQSLAASRMNKQIYSKVLIYLNKNNPNSYLQFEFEYGGHNEFNQQLSDQLVRKKWLYSVEDTANRLHNVGIVGIQRKIQDRLDQQDQKIHNSFKDLSILMNQAKEMVNLSNLIIAKLAKDNKINNEEDEDMKRLKGYFLNMGIIDNPVTKESSGSKYYRDLALEISNNFTQIIMDAGGIMTLSDVYCRLNRARAIAGLVSVDDLMNACKQINKLNLKLKYNVYVDNNLHVLEIEHYQVSAEKFKQITEFIEKNECLTPYGLSKF